MFDHQAALKRLRAIGIPAGESHQILLLVQKWIQCSGEEWTVARIKSIKLDLLRLISGLPPLKSHSWIRYDASGAPKGAFRPLFRVPKRGFARAWNAVMIYTGLMFDHPELRVTVRQWKKAMAAINRPPVDPDALVEGLRCVHSSPLCDEIQVGVVGQKPIKRPKFRITVEKTTGDPLLLYAVRENRRAPAYLRTVPDDNVLAPSLVALISRSVWTTQNWDILSGVCQGLENKILPDVELNNEFELKAGGSLSDEERPWMGHIALIQEAGYKLRFAANPFRAYQQALRPLGTALFSALKRLPNDFTFDQERGVAYVQELIRKGHKMASMDLTNATDNAPLELQLALLDRLGVSTRWLQFFGSCSRGDWSVKLTKTKGEAGWTTVRWTVGSPLGLYPTFASFSLWHHCLVQSCFRDTYGPKVDTYPYAIVGDDVVIGDWDVAALYRERMTALGVPIHPDKTLVATTVAEFVGRVITEKSVVMGVKWKGRVTDSSFVDFARNIGPGALLLMTRRQRRVLSFIADFPEPYGLGWNPLGIPLEERWNPSLERVWSRDERVRTFSSRASRVNRLLFAMANEERTVPGREPEAETLASDQEASDVTHILLPGWESWGEAIWANVADLGLERELDGEIREKFFSFLQRNSSLETVTESPTLVVLERKIRRVLSRSR